MVYHFIISFLDKGGEWNLNYIMFISKILHENSLSQLKTWSIQLYPECLK